MTHATFTAKLLFLLVLVSGLGLRAQELTVLGGTTSQSSFQKTTYNWQIDYRQDFYQNLAASIAYINEGHVPGHHRDGTAWEGWINLPL